MTKTDRRTLDRPLGYVSTADDVPDHVLPPARRDRRRNDGDLSTHRQYHYLYDDLLS